LQAENDESIDAAEDAGQQALLAHLLDVVTELQLLDVLFTVVS